MADLIPNRSYRQSYYHNYFSLIGDQKDLELKDYQNLYLHARLPPELNTPLLDLGCGTGISSIFISSLYGPVMLENKAFYKS